MKSNHERNDSKNGPEKFHGKRVKRQSNQLNLPSVSSKFFLSNHFVIDFYLTSNFKKVAIGENNGMILVYDTNLTLVFSFKAHESYINRIKLLPNGYVATCSFDNTSKIWNPLNVNQLLVQTHTNHSAPINALEYIDSDMIATGSNDCTIQLWSIRTGLTNMSINAGANVYSLQLLSVYRICY